MIHHPVDDPSHHSNGHSTSASTTSLAGLCVVCQAPAGEADMCCSLRCAVKAQQELDRNVVHVYRLRRARSGSDHLHQLMARNGQLSQALMRWRSPRHGVTA